MIKGQSDMDEIAQQIDVDALVMLAIRCCAGGPAHLLSKFLTTGSRSLTRLNNLQQVVTQLRRGDGTSLSALLTLDAIAFACRWSRVEFVHLGAVEFLLARPEFHRVLGILCSRCPPAVARLCSSNGIERLLSVL